MFTSFVKRDGKVVDFDSLFVSRAIRKAFGSLEIDADEETIKELTAAAVSLAFHRHPQPVCLLETMQNAVEDTLLERGYSQVAKAYISYRTMRNVARQAVVPQYLEELAKEELRYLQNPFAVFVYKRTYAKYLPQKRRREFWMETVSRFMAYVRQRHNGLFSVSDLHRIEEAILNLRVMPSMRLLQFAGPVCDRNDLCAYNCCYVAPTSITDIRDIMYLSMCGVGVGFSVEQQFVRHFPLLSPRAWDILHHRIEDSKEGWCDAFALALSTWWNGNDITFDYSAIRPAGARLKTTGGKASGPLPLINLFRHCRTLLYVNRPEDGQVTPLMIHSIICKIGEIVVAGSIRRSALISLSDLSDEKLRDCKSGEWWNTNPHFQQANNSAVYTARPSFEEFDQEWQALRNAGSGERGIFNRSFLRDQLPPRRLEILTEEDLSSLGCNPCGEIILQSGGLCNLSSVICRPTDTKETLLDKIEIASMIGTFQSSLTNFHYVQDKFRQKAEQERLLGVSLAGQMDCPVVREAEVLHSLYRHAVDINVQYSSKVGLNPSTCVTTVKPDGTLGLVTGASPGVHPAHAPFYIRRVRISSTDPLCKFLRDFGVPWSPEVGQTVENAHTLVFDFPQRAKEYSVCRHDVTALDMLEYWKLVKTNYTEHNPSVTVSVRTNEWDTVRDWLLANWDIVGGLSFLPYCDAFYKLQPYEDISEEEYQRRHAEIGELNFAALAKYEYEDETNQLGVSACSGGLCHE